MNIEDLERRGSIVRTGSGYFVHIPDNHGHTNRYEERSIEEIVNSGDTDLMDMSSYDLGSNKVVNIPRKQGRY